MIINLIVGTALLLAGGFSLLWFFSPSLRERIEHPKHSFLDSAHSFDQQIQVTSKTRTGTHYED